MKNLFSIYMSILFIFLLGSCKNEVDTSYVADYRTVYMAKAVDVQNYIFQQSSGSNKVYVAANYGGVDYAPEDINVTFQIDESLVGEYNNQFGTNYAVLPSQNVTFAQQQSTIKKGDLQTEALPINIDFTGLPTFTKFLLPVKITSVSGNVPLKEQMKTTYFHIEVRSEPTPIKIMALGKGGANNDMDKLVSIIKEANPDVVLIREIDRNTTRSGSTNDWPAILAQKLGAEYNHLFTPSILSYQGGQYGMSTFSKFAINSAENYRLSANGTNQSETSERGPLAVLDLNVNGKSLKLATVHTNSNATARATQLGEMIQILGPNDNKPFILVGNMNVNPSGGDAYAALSGIDFLPVCTSCQPNFSAANPTSWSDMVLVRPADRMQLVSHRVGTTAQVIGGTHLPIFTTVNVYF